MNSQNITAIVDCNNFYASCERVFNPKLRNRPVIVLSNNDGCVVARSNEAKVLGIPMGIPFFEVEKIVKKENVAIFSSNYALYADMSNRVMTILAKYAPEIELYSIDEAFLNFTGVDKTYNLTELGQVIKKEVYQFTGIPISIGIATTKTLAKVANKIAKKHRNPNGVYNFCELSEHQLDRRLALFEVGDVWGIGKQYEKFLKSRDIHTAYQLKTTPDDFIQENLTIVGLRTVKELRGEPCIELETTRKAKKQIISSKSFSKSVTTKQELREAVATYITRAAEKLREQNSVASSLSVFFHTNLFNQNKKQYSNTQTVKLAEQSDYTPYLIKTAFALVDKMYKDGYEYKKAGVFLSGIIPNSGRQENFFADNSNFDRNKKVMAIVDRINLEHGRNSVKFAAVGTKQEWYMKQARKSPAYTTRWSDILVVK